MILALDSYYNNDVCNTSLVIFENIHSSSPVYTDTIYTAVTAEYIPGQFYKRELPGIIQILDKLMDEHPEYWNNIDVIITDSFLRLKTETDEWNGLGMHLYDYLACKNQPKIIYGVAKSKFGKCDEISETITRGSSNTPLYVQSTDDMHHAAEQIKNMHGEFRMPTMLKLVDSLSRIF